MAWPHEKRDTPLSDAWLEQLRVELEPRGVKADLARFLCGDDQTKIAARRVQIAKIVNQGVMPDTEFLLSVEAWRQQAKR